jgi:hypothetical protein
MGQLSVTHACFRSKVNRTVAGSPANVTIITHMKHYEWRQRDPRGEAAMGNSHCVRRSRQIHELEAFFQRMRPTSIRTRRIISVMKAERTLILLLFVCEIVQEPVQSERRGVMPKTQLRSCVCDDHPYRETDLLYAREAILPRNTAQAIVMMNLLRSQIAALRRRASSFRCVPMQQYNSYTYTRRMINADEKVNERFPNTCKVTNWSRKWHSDGTRHLTKAERTHA